MSEQMNQAESLSEELQSSRELTQLEKFLAVTNIMESEIEYSESIREVLLSERVFSTSN